MQVAEIHRLLAVAGASGGGEVDGAVGAHIVEHGGNLYATSGSHRHIVCKGLVTTNSFVFRLGHVVVHTGSGEILAEVGFAFDIGSGGGVSFIPIGLHLGGHVGRGDEARIVGEGVQTGRHRGNGGFVIDKGLGGAVHFGPVGLHLLGHVSRGDEVRVVVEVAQVGGSVAEVAIIVGEGHSGERRFVADVVPVKNNKAAIAQIESVVTDTQHLVFGSGRG